MVSDPDWRMKRSGARVLLEYEERLGERSFSGAARAQ